MKKSFVIIFLAVSFVCHNAAFAKTECGPLKYPIAIGSIDTGQFSFQNGNPQDLGNLLRLKVKKELEARGCYAVILVEPEAAAQEAPGGAQGQDVPLPSDTTKGGKKKSQMQNAQEMMAYTSQVMKQMARMQRMTMGASGIPQQPVAAQGLYDIIVKVGEGGLNTSGVIGVAGAFTDTPLGLGDFASKSTKISLTCVARDPQTGSMLDQKAVKASSTRLERVAGVESYYIEDSIDRDKAYDRLFQKSMRQCVDWMEERTAGKPWEGGIFKVEGGRAFINAGSAAGVKPGQAFQVLSKESVQGQGAVFGKAEKPMGTLQVDDVQENYSIGRMTSGGVPAAGMVLRAQ